MQEIIEEVLLLQAGWTSTNTLDMNRRGILVRREGADWLRGLLTLLSDAAGPQIEDLAVEGRDGTGPKSELPWLRFHSVSRSPSATIGWDVVYLFDAEGERAYLSLNQGSTTWSGDAFVPRPTEVLNARVNWARAVLGSELNDPRLTPSIELRARRTPLGPAYEAGNVVADTYPIDAVP